jgi:hypothetical protein
VEELRGTSRRTGIIRLPDGDSNFFQKNVREIRAARGSKRDFLTIASIALNRVIRGRVFAEICMYEKVLTGFDNVVRPGGSLKTNNHTSIGEKYDAGKNIRKTNDYGPD